MSAMIERLEKMLAEGADGALLRFSLGNTWLSAGDAPRAVEHLRRAVALDDGYSAAWKTLGRALERCERPDEAAEAYRTGIGHARRKGDKQAEREMRVFLRRLRGDEDLAGPAPARRPD